MYPEIFLGSPSSSCRWADIKPGGKWTQRRHGRSLSTRGFLVLIPSDILSLFKEIAGVEESLHTIPYYTLPCRKPQNYKTLAFLLWTWSPNDVDCTSGQWDYQHSPLSTPQTQFPLFQVAPHIALSWEAILWVSHPHCITCYSLLQHPALFSSCLASLACLHLYWCIHLLRATASVLLHGCKGKL